MDSEHILTVYDYSTSISNLFNYDFDRVLILNNFRTFEIERPIINVFSNLDYSSSHKKDYKNSLTFGASIDLEELTKLHYTKRNLSEEAFIQKTILENYISNVNKAELNFIKLDKK